MTQVSVAPAIMPDGDRLACVVRGKPLPLYKVTIAGPDRFGAYYLTAQELATLRDALCVAVPDDDSEPEALGPLEIA